MGQEYVGREQSLLKHRVLREYLLAWAVKLGSVADRITQPVRLWYLDCFAGPWGNTNADLEDTSVAIGLNSLEEALGIWNEGGDQVQASALFIGKSTLAGQQLREFVDKRKSAVECSVLVGEFGDHVHDIENRIGDDAAFIFVDPKGWKGADMSNIARLASKRYRDVLVNVMYEHLARFKNDEREFLRHQMENFFGLEGDRIPPGINERELLELYRQQLKRACDLKYAADIAVPFPDKDRTYYRLVIGGNHSKVIELFRDVEDKVIGKEAAHIRDGVAKRKRGDAQLELGTLAKLPEGTIDRRHRKLHDDDKASAVAFVLQKLQDGPLAFGKIWPLALEEFHLTKRLLAKELLEDGRFDVQLSGRERSIKDKHIIKLRAS